MGNNRFIHQPVFKNKNLQLKWKGKLRCFLQEDFGYHRLGTLSVNQCFEGTTFISYEQFLANNSHIPEGAYLKLKKTLLEIFSKKGKYPPPLINKAVPEWNIESIRKLFSTRKKGSKKFRAIIRDTKNVKDNTISWQKALQDASVTRETILHAHEFSNNKTLHPSFHDQKFRFLSRKTQFNNQLNKHTPTSPFCEWCFNTLNKEIKETLIHAMWDCPKISNIYTDTITNLKLDHLTSFPLTPQQVILYDEFSSAPTLINSVWLLMVCSILGARHNNIPINYVSLSSKVMFEIKSTNKSRPNKNLNAECRYLTLLEFLASHEAEGFHWTSLKTTTVLEI